MLYPNFNDLIAFKDRKSDLKYPTRQSVRSTASGNHHSPFRGQGLEFDSVREYVAGDDIRSIDWRVTARMGTPHVKLLKEERERYITICVDMNAAMRFGTRNTFKSVQAAHTAAFLGWQGIARQDRVGACLFGDVQNGVQFFEPKRTRLSFCNILKTLAEPPKEQYHIPLGEALKKISQTAHTGSLIYLISDFMSIDKNFQQNASLNQLRKRCDVVMVAINDQADSFLSPAGMIGFCSNAKEKIYVNTESEAGRKSYAEQWKENRQQLREIATRLRIPKIELTTESDVRRELALQVGPGPY
jgi:uncharacterized protein (DUF58 family)